MPQKQFTFKYKIADQLVIGVSTLIAEYLHGIPLTDSSGISYSVESMKKKLIETTKQISNILYIQLGESTVTEQLDFIEEEWWNWAHIKVGHPINSLISVEGWLSSSKVLTLNVTAFVAKGRNLSFVPGATALGSLVVGSGGNIIIVRSGVRVIPNFWHVTYKTGFVDIPPDVLKVICKLTCIQIMAILGDIILGAGIASQSLSIDGLSQSIGTTVSPQNSAYMSRIKQYAQEIETQDLPYLKDYYRGITFEVM